MDDPKWIFDPGKMRGDVCNNKKREGVKKIHNPLKLKPRSWAWNILSSSLLCLCPFYELFSCKEKPIGLTSASVCLWQSTDCKFSMLDPQGGIQVKPYKYFKTISCSLDLLLTHLPLLASKFCLFTFATNLSSL